LICLRRECINASKIECLRCLGRIFDLWRGFYINLKGIHIVNGVSSVVSR